MTPLTFRREFQLEVVPQERREAVLDLLGFGSGSSEPEKMIICVADVVQPPEAGITGISAGEAAHPLVQRRCRQAVTALAGASGRHPYPCVLRKPNLEYAPGVFGDENCLGELVQPVEVNTGKDRGNHTALRAAAEGRVPFPVLQVTGLEHLLNEPEEPVVVDILRQDGEHDRMVKAAETIGDVSLDKPGCPGPVCCHFAQRGVAATAGTETV